MENSKIEWTHHTFNPWIGCTKVSDGCKFCYAENLMDKRYGRVKWGPQGTRQRTSAANWRKPRQWNKRLEGTGRRERVFCASLADVFEDRPELMYWRTDLFTLIQQTPNLDWLLLTKRPENVMDMLRLDWAASLPPNVWIGTSVENQEQADKRIPELLRIPAAVRFLSCEPLLGPVSLTDIGYYPTGNEDEWIEIDVLTGACTDQEGNSENFNGRAGGDGVDWVIVGGESGSNARLFDAHWAYDLAAQCAEAGVAFFMKQLGENFTGLPFNQITDKKGGDWSEWPEELCIREFPQ